MSKPTDEEIEEFYRRLAAGAQADLIPKMRQSFMSITLLDGTVDCKLALEIGVALLLDKPLLIVAIGKNVQVSPRLRQIADLVIEGETFDDAIKAKMQAEVERLMRRHRGSLQ